MGKTFLVTAVLGMLISTATLAFVGKNLTRMVPGGERAPTAARSRGPSLLEQVQARMRPGARLSSVQIRHLEELERARAEEARAGENRPANGGRRSRGPNRPPASGVAAADPLGGTLDALAAQMGLEAAPVDWDAEAERRARMDSGHDQTWADLEALQATGASPSAVLGLGALQRSADAEVGKTLSVLMGGAPAAGRTAPAEPD